MFQVCNARLHVHALLIFEMFARLQCYNNNSFWNKMYLSFPHSDISTLSFRMLNHFTIFEINSNADVAVIVYVR